MKNNPSGLKYAAWRWQGLYHLKSIAKPDC